MDRYSIDIAPEICVEAMAPGNYLELMMYKKQLYFNAGALEFWLCSQHGEMTFFDQNGEIERSVLVPEIPKQLVLL